MNGKSPGDDSTQQQNDYGQLQKKDFGQHCSFGVESRSFSTTLRTLPMSRPQPNTGGTVGIDGFDTITLISTAAVRIFRLDSPIESGRAGRRLGNGVRKLAIW